MLKITDTAKEIISKILSKLQSFNIQHTINNFTAATDLVSELNTIFENSSNYKQLHITDSAEVFLGNLNYNFDNYTNEGQTLYSYEIANTKEKLLNVATQDSLTLFLCTDIHYGYGITMNINSSVPYILQNTVDNMKSVKTDNVNGLLCLGDLFHGSASELDTDSNTSAKTLINKSIQYLQSTGLPLYINVGNHDNNRNGFGVGYSSYNAKQLAEMYIENAMLNNPKASIDNIHFYNESSDDFENNKNYKLLHYTDFLDSKIRMINIYGNNTVHIFSSTVDYRFEDQTIEFLEDSLNSMEDGYKAIITTHVPINGPMGYLTNKGTYQIPQNSDDLVSVLEQNYDKIICVLYGHMHKDAVFGSPCLCIGTCCTMFENSDKQVSRWPIDSYQPLRVLNDASCDLWDIVNVDTTEGNELITIIRFGAGADRIIHYKPIICNAGDTINLSNTTPDGGEWGLRSDDIDKADIESGTLTVNSNLSQNSIITVTYKSKDWEINSNGELKKGSSIEYWIVKVNNQI